MKPRAHARGDVSAAPHSRWPCPRAASGSNQDKARVGNRWLGVRRVRVRRRRVASKLILGGPPEFKDPFRRRARAEEELRRHLQGYKVLDIGGPVTVTALKNGQVDAADLFTTDPSLQANGFVILQDPKSNFAAQNIVPIINKEKATDGVKAVLNGISSKLTTDA